MASYHFHAKIIGRSKGRSVVAAAAYRAGARLESTATGDVFDYSRRRGMVHAEIMAPAGTDASLLDRATLWNAVEAQEKRRDAQLCREVELALPHELDAAARLALLRAFVAEEFVARGMVADVAIHAPVPEKGDDPRNHHAHVLLSLRRIDATTGRFFRTKTREWNSDAMLDHWRTDWERRQNAALERAHVPARVDHRSLAARRTEALESGNHAEARLLARQPELHVGPRARAAARRGYMPQSRERTVGLRQRPKGQGKAATRRVLYPAIDQGSRFAANVARVERNAARAEQSLSHLQVRHQRWQRQLAFLDDAGRALQRAEDRAAWMRARQRDRDVAAILRFLGSPLFADRRRQRLKAIVPFEASFIGQLLGLKTAQLKRQRSLLLSLERGREHERGRQKPRRRE